MVQMRIVSGISERSSWYMQLEGMGYVVKYAEKTTIRVRKSREEESLEMERVQR